MKYTHQTEFGRLDTAVQIKQITSEHVDKWDILAALTDAAASYELNHRTLGVLKALMSFLPERMISPEMHGAIVFPSNRTLAKRLNNMPESTLRRHLAQLTSTGIVSRHDSANRKRFARNVDQQRQIAFGIDLSPLARLAGDIMRHANEANQLRERLAVQRAKVAQLRQDILTQLGSTPHTDAAARLLRRIPVADDLQKMQDLLEERLDALNTEKVSTTNAQNERHIQYQIITIPDSEDHDQTEDSKNDLSQTKPDTSINNHTNVSLFEVTSTCNEYKTFYPNPVRHWDDLARIAERLIPMMGIETVVFKDAIKRMGLQNATTVVLCILERIGTIRNPGGYLRRMAQNATGNRFDLLSLLKSISTQRNCQLTI